MLLIAVCILINSAVLSGIGWLVMKIARMAVFTQISAAKAFWLGWAVVIAVLQIWHFFLPVNFLLLIFILITSAAGWYFLVRNAKIKEILTPSNLVFAAFMVLPLIILSNHVMFSEPSYDHGLYHFQTVKWFNQFPLVRGLGNLHHRLAFNATSMLYGALLNTGPLKGYGFYFANATMIFVVLVQLLWSLMNWLKQPFWENRNALFNALILPVVLWQASVYPLPGYSADMTIFALQVILAGAWLSLVDQSPHETGFKHNALFIAVLVAAGITVKLSFAVFGAALLVCMLVLWLRAPAQKGRFSAPFVWAGLLGIWVLPWLARNAFMSGYLLYPTQLLSLPVQWKMPSFLINDISSGITLWARTYSGQIAYTADPAWFATWLIRFVYEPRLAFVLGVVILVLLAIFSIIAKKKVSIYRGYVMLIIISLFSIIFWFISGPTYRFSGAAIWIFFFSAVLAMYQFIDQQWGGMVAARFALLIMMFMFFNLRPEFSRNISPSRLLFPVNEQAVAEQQQPLAGMTTGVTLSGLKVNMPPEQNPETCWDYPLPCTTRNDFVERLQLIDPQDISKGFYIPDSL